MTSAETAELINSMQNIFSPLNISSPLDGRRRGAGQKPVLEPVASQRSVLPIFKQYLFNRNLLESIIIPKRL